MPNAPGGDLYEFFRERFTISIPASSPSVYILDAPSLVHGGEDMEVTVGWSNVPEGWKLNVSLEESEENYTRLADDMSRPVMDSGNETFKLKVYPTGGLHPDARVCACLYGAGGGWTGIFDKRALAVHPGSDPKSIPLVFGIVASVILIAGIFLLGGRMRSNTRKKPSGNLNKKTLTELSKLMAHILRHDKELKFRVELDKNCYADISRLVKAISSMGKWKWVNRRHIEEVVDRSFYRNKKRFAIKGDKIKATYRITRNCPSSSTSRPQPAPRSTFKENEYYVIIAKHSGKCLDVQSKHMNDGAKIMQLGYLGGDNQKWKLEPVGGGYFRIIAKHSGKCLDVQSKHMNDGAKIMQLGYLGGDNQKWKLEPVGGGYFRIIAKHSGKCLDVQSKHINDGASVVQFRYLGGDNQKWRLEPVRTPPQPPEPPIASTGPTLPPTIHTSQFATLRTIWDPSSKDFVWDAGKPDEYGELPRIKRWIEDKNPNIYWFLLKIVNHADHPVTEWNVTLYTEQALTITEAHIDEKQVRIVKSDFDTGTNRNICVVAIPPELGVSIPANGGRRSMYFKMDIRCEDALKMEFGVSGVVKLGKSPQVEVSIREKRFTYACKYGDFRPWHGITDVEKALQRSYTPPVVAAVINSLRLIHEFEKYCNDRYAESEVLIEKLEVVHSSLKAAEPITKDEILPLVEENLAALRMMSGVEAQKERGMRMCERLVELLHIATSGVK